MVHTTKQSNMLSLPHQDDCKTRKDTKKNAQQNMEQPQTPPPHTHTHTHNGNNNKQLSHFAGGGSLSTFKWYQVFAQDYKVLLLKQKKMFKFRLPSNYCNVLSLRNVLIRLH